MKLSEEAKTIIKEMLISGELVDVPLFKHSRQLDASRTTWGWTSGHTHDLFYLSYFEDEGWGVLSSHIITDGNYATPEEALEEYRRVTKGEAE